jgi:RHS repeat-associated protein
MLFVKTKNTNGQDTIAYYHHDHLNTPLQATDKNGNIVWAATYEAFGRVTIVTPTATTNQPTITSNLRLPGQYEDQETGLYYNWYRFYDPNTGRYISKDPIGLEGGINTYLYGESNPVNLTDPTGENPAAIRLIIAGALAGARAAIKKCLGNPACKCRAIYASYKIMCGIGCNGTTCPIVTAQVAAAALCFQLRTLYISSGCDRVIPTTRDHPGAAAQAKRAWENCAAKMARVCNSCMVN